MAKAEAFYKGNAMVVRLVLKDEDGNSVAGALATVTVVHEDGVTPLAGVAWPLALSPTQVGGNDYRVTIPHTHQGGEDGERYRAQITADVAGERLFYDKLVTGLRREG